MILPHLLRKIFFLKGQAGRPGQPGEPGSYKIEIGSPYCIALDNRHPLTTMFIVGPPGRPGRTGPPGNYI